LKEMGRYIGLPHSSQTQRRPIDRPARTKRVNFFMTVIASNVMMICHLCQWQR